VGLLFIPRHPSKRIEMNINCNTELQTWRALFIFSFINQNISIFYIISRRQWNLNSILMVISSGYAAENIDIQQSTERYDYVTFGKWCLYYSYSVLQPLHILTYACIIISRLTVDCHSSPSPLFLLLINKLCAHSASDIHCVSCG